MNHEFALLFLNLISSLLNRMYILLSIIFSLAQYTIDHIKAKIYHMNLVQFLESCYWWN